MRRGASLAACCGPANWLRSRRWPRQAEPGDVVRKRWLPMSCPAGRGIRWIRGTTPRRTSGCCGATSRCCASPRGSCSCRCPYRPTWPRARWNGPLRPRACPGGGQKASGCARQGSSPPRALAQIGAAPHAGGLSLRYADRSLTWRAYRAWRREPGRERLAHRSSRFAVVGLVGRLIDAVIRLSLLVRGRVPGGTAAAADQAYRAGPAPARMPTTVASPGTAVSSRCSTGSCTR